NTPEKNPRQEQYQNDRSDAIDADQQSIDEPTLGNLEYLREFNGKYPYEVNLFDNQDFTDRLKNLLGSRYDFLISTWAVEFPIEVNNDIFVASACEAHNCDATNFIIVVDFSSNVMYAGIREEYNVETYSEDGSNSSQINNWAR
ncbi:MAG: hypothetical protein JW866_02405, partial [Ignavibacteriales bacterium]|nr:hypothetical protein [Ignavibacteriales bacterium]